MSPTLLILTTESSVASTSPSSPNSPLQRPYQGVTAPAHRVRLCYRDEAYRQRSEARAKFLIAAAASPTSSDISALLAKKALKYRKVYDRMTGVDVDDPNFDVFDFLGVDWCKSPSAKTSGRV